MSQQQIIQAMQDAQTALSSKGVAQYLGIDATSEALNEIRSLMWQMAEQGLLQVIDRRDSEKCPGLFFQVAKISNVA